MYHAIKGHALQSFSAIEIMTGRAGADALLLNLQLLSSVCNP